MVFRLKATLAAAAAILMTSLSAEAALIGRHVAFTSTELTFSFDLQFDSTVDVHSSTAGFSNISAPSVLTGLGWAFSSSTHYVSIFATWAPGVPPVNKFFNINIAGADGSHPNVDMLRVDGDDINTGISNLSTSVTAFEPAVTAPSPAPEPGMLALLSAAGLAFLASRRR